MAGSARRFLRGLLKAPKILDSLWSAPARISVERVLLSEKRFAGRAAVEPKDDYAEEFLERSIFLKEIWKQR